MAYNALMNLMKISKIIPLTLQYLVYWGKKKRKKAVR